MKTNASKAKDSIIDPAIPDYELCLEWSVRVRGRDEEIVNIEGRTPYPMGLHPDFFGATVCDFPKLFETLVTKPVQMSLNRRARLLFEEETRQAEAQIKAGRSVAGSKGESRSSLFEESVAAQTFEAETQDADNRKAA